MINIAGAFYNAKQVLRQNKLRKKMVRVRRNARLFMPSKIVRLRNRNFFRDACLQTRVFLSSDYEVVRTRNVNIVVRNIRLGEEMLAHHDRFSNPLHIVMLMFCLVTKRMTPTELSAFSYKKILTKIN